MTYTNNSLITGRNRKTLRDGFAGNVNLYRRLFAFETS